MENDLTNDNFVDMETRTVEQIHIFFIVLNRMYDRCEGRDIVAISDDRQKLIDFYNNNLLSYDKRYRDDCGMYRSFKKGPLYDFNPPMDEEFIKDEWVTAGELDRARQMYAWIN